MQSILDAINEWIKEILIGAINGNLSTMFGDVNEKVGTIAAEVGQTPQGWNANIFSMIQTLSENVIVPIVDLANAVKADKERGKEAKPEKKPSIRAQLRADKEKAQKKNAKQKLQDLERS